MYVPSVFLEDDLATLHELMRAARLPNLVMATAEGVVSTPLPLLLAPDEGPYGTLYGHLARANTQWRQKPVGDAMALFMGPDAYISPSWYPSKQEHHQVVPTWNYIAVNAYGPVAFFEDEARLLDLVTRLTDHHERSRARPWAVEDAPDGFIKNQLKAIIGVRLPITRFEGKRKMSQNRTANDRRGVAAGLARGARASERAVAGLIPL